MRGVVDAGESAYLAHSENRHGEPQRLADHLTRVASLTERFADAFGAGEEARLVGLLHDLGKYGDLFQLRLQGKEHRIDHWSLGAWHAAATHRNIAVAVAVHGHHIGLQSADSLRGLSPSKVGKHPLGLKVSGTDPEELIRRLSHDGVTLPTPAPALYGPRLRQTASAMLDIRMLFSALVDADFVDTEAHFDPETASLRQHPVGQPELRPGQALEALLDHLGSLASSASASHSINAIRADLLQACLTAAESPQRLWTLSAPTGAGKTLAMLAFALSHAAAHDLRRIVVVIPYLSIIEQTARIYRSILAPRLGEAYLLEHHSLTGTGAERAADGGDELDGDSKTHRLRQSTAENWDAPLIVSTSVQMLESLFSNRPSACRKLHRLARSVILFDEVQTLPDHLIVSTLATLSWLAERYHATVVFSTATQPAFAHFDRHVLQLGDSSWQPKEMAPSSLRLFDRARRTDIEWPDLGGRTPWEEIATEMSSVDQGLCVVNVKAHARDLFRVISERAGDGCFHLSTAMCPLHRQEVLKAVRTRLAAGRPCWLVSTQCVEAGVDVDFPVVYRALGPLEAIAQAAGRCNRNGLRASGHVKVFVPEDESLPPGVYKQATGVTCMLLKEYGSEGMDIESPELFEAYYRRLYDLTRPEGKRHRLAEAIKRQDFVEVARLYRLIEQDTINVLVPYRRGEFDELAADARDTGLSSAWIRAAQPHTVGVYRPRESDAIWPGLEPVRLGRGSPSTDWFICTDPESYDRHVGLLPPQSPHAWLI